MTAISPERLKQNFIIFIDTFWYANDSDFIYLYIDVVSLSYCSNSALAPIVLLKYG